MSEDNGTADGQSPQQLATWFDPVVRYEGQGTVCFENPPIVAVGRCWAEFDEAGSGLASMDIERIGSPDSLPLGAFHAMHEGPAEQDVEKGTTSISIGRDTKSNRCLGLRIEDKQGAFIARPPLGHGASFSFGSFGFRTRFNFTIFDGVHIARQDTPKYWAIPLVNFDFGHLRSGDILDHPLRLFSRAQTDGSEGGKGSNPHRDSRYVQFRYRGMEAFIEPLFDSKERISRLSAGRDRRLVTALMVGTLPAQMYKEDEIIRWLPSDITSLLSMATGTDVGGNSIQIFDEKGGLLARIHKPISCSPYAPGHRFVDEIWEGSIGTLLTVGTESERFDSALLRVTASHIVRGGNRELTIEDRLSHLIRGLDGLCRMLHISGRTAIDSLLSDGEAREAKNWVRSLSKQIRAREAACSQNGQEAKARAYNRFAQNVESSRMVASGFGADIARLIRAHKLHDLDVLDAYYTESPGPGNRDWLATLSYYRGLVLHDGYIKLDQNPNAYYEAYAIANHLQDLLIRIMLKLLAYSGKYLPATIGVTSPSSLDWITPTTSPDLLGYQPG